MTDVFDSTQGNASNSGAADSTTDDQPVYEFIGEGKQYATSGAALASIPHKDEHIANIEKENAEMRKQIAEGKTLEDVISAVRTNGEQNGQSTDDAQGGNTSPLDVAGVVKDVLQQERNEATVKSNVNSANEFMLTTFGEKAGEVAGDKAKELGMSLDGLREIAVRSPAAYQALFKTTQQASVTTTHGDVNTQAHLDNSLSGEDKYTDLMKKDKRHFLSQDVQKAQMAEAMRNPSEYFKT